MSKPNIITAMVIVLVMMLMSQLFAFNSTAQNLSTILSQNPNPNPNHNHNPNPNPNPNFPPTPTSLFSPQFNSQSSYCSLFTSTDPLICGDPDQPNHCLNGATGDACEYPFLGIVPTFEDINWSWLDSFESTLSPYIFFQNQEVYIAFTVIKDNIPIKIAFINVQFNKILPFNDLIITPTSPKGKANVPKYTGDLIGWAVAYIPASSPQADLMDISKWVSVTPPRFQIYSSCYYGLYSPWSNDPIATTCDLSAPKLNSESPTSQCNHGFFGPFCSHSLQLFHDEPILWSNDKVNVMFKYIPGQNRAITTFYPTYYSFSSSYFSFEPIQPAIDFSETPDRIILSFVPSSFPTQGDESIGIIFSRSFYDLSGFNEYREEIRVTLPIYVDLPPGLDKCVPNSVLTTFASNGDRIYTCRGCQDGYFGRICQFHVKSSPKIQALILPNTPIHFLVEKVLVNIDSYQDEGSFGDNIQHYIDDVLSTAPISLKLTPLTSPPNHFIATYLPSQGFFTNAEQTVQISLKLVLQNAQFDKTDPILSFSVSNFNCENGLDPNTIGCDSDGNYICANGFVGEECWDLQGVQNQMTKFDHKIISTTSFTSPSRLYTRVQFRPVFTLNPSLEYPSQEMVMDISNRWSFLTPTITIDDWPKDPFQFFDIFIAVSTSETVPENYMYTYVSSTLVDELTPAQLGYNYKQNTLCFEPNTSRSSLLNTDSILLQTPPYIANPSCQCREYSSDFKHVVIGSHCQTEIISFSGKSTTYVGDTITLQTSTTTGFAPGVIYRAIALDVITKYVIVIPVLFDEILFFTIPPTMSRGAWEISFTELPSLTPFVLQVLEPEKAIVMPGPGDIHPCLVNGTGIDPDTGLCLCKLGYYGPLCDISFKFDASSSPIPYNVQLIVFYKSTVVASFDQAPLEFQNSLSKLRFFFYHVSSDAPISHASVSIFNNNRLLLSGILLDKAAGPQEDYYAKVGYDNLPLLLVQNLHVFSGTPNTPPTLWVDSITDAVACSSECLPSTPYFPGTRTAWVYMVDQDQTFYVQNWSGIELEDLLLVPFNQGPTRITTVTTDPTITLQLQGFEAPNFSPFGTPQCTPLPTDPTRFECSFEIQYYTSDSIPTPQSLTLQFNGAAGAVSKTLTVASPNHFYSLAVTSRLGLRQYSPLPTEPAATASNSWCMVNGSKLYGCTCSSSQDTVFLGEACELRVQKSQFPTKLGEYLHIIVQSTTGPIDITNDDIIYNFPASKNIDLALKTELDQGGYLSAFLTFKGVKYQIFSSANPYVDALGCSACDSTNTVSCEVTVDFTQCNCKPGQFSSTCQGTNFPFYFTPPAEAFFDLQSTQIDLMNTILLGSTAEFHKSTQDIPNFSTSYRIDSQLFTITTGNGFNLPQNPPVPLSDPSNQRVLLNSGPGSMSQTLPFGDTLIVDSDGYGYSSNTPFEPFIDMIISVDGVTHPEWHFRGTRAITKHKWLKLPHKSSVLPICVSEHTLSPQLNQYFADFNAHFAATPQIPFPPRAPSSSSDRNIDSYCVCNEPVEKHGKFFVRLGNHCQSTLSFKTGPYTIGEQISYELITIDGYQPAIIRQGDIIVDGGGELMINTNTNVFEFPPISYSSFLKLDINTSKTYKTQIRDIVVLASCSAHPLPFPCVGANQLGCSIYTPPKILDFYPASLCTCKPGTLGPDCRFSVFVTAAPLFTETDMQEQISFFPNSQQVSYIVTISRETLVNENLLDDQYDPWIFTIGDVVVPLTQTAPSTTFNIDFREYNNNDEVIVKLQGKYFPYSFLTYQGETSLQYSDPSSNFSKIRIISTDVLIDSSHLDCQDFSPQTPSDSQLIFSDSKPVVRCNCALASTPQRFGVGCEYILTLTPESFLPLSPSTPPSLFTDNAYEVKVYNGWFDGSLVTSDFELIFTDSHNQPQTAAKNPQGFYDLSTLTLDPNQFNNIFFISIDQFNNPYGPNNRPFVFSSLDFTQALIQFQHVYDVDVHTFSCGDYPDIINGGACAAGPGISVMCDSLRSFPYSLQQNDCACPFGRYGSLCQYEIELTNMDPDIEAYNIFELSVNTPRIKGNSWQEVPNSVFNLPNYYDFSFELRNVRALWDPVNTVEVSIDIQSGVPDSLRLTGSLLTGESYYLAIINNNIIPSHFRMTIVDVPIKVLTYEEFLTKKGINCVENNTSQFNLTIGAIETLNHCVCKPGYFGSYCQNYIDFYAGDDEIYADKTVRTEMGLISGKKFTVSAQSTSDTLYILMKPDNSDDYQVYICTDLSNCVYPTVLVDFPYGLTMYIVYSSLTNSSGQPLTEQDTYSLRPDDLVLLNNNYSGPHTVYALGSVNISIVNMSTRNDKRILSVSWGSTRAPIVATLYQRFLLFYIPHSSPNYPLTATNIDFTQAEILLHPTLTQLRYISVPNSDLNTNWVPETTTQEGLSGVDIEIPGWFPRGSMSSSDGDLYLVTQSSYINQASDPNSFISITPFESGLFDQLLNYQEGIDYKKCQNPNLCDPFDPNTPLCTSPPCYGHIPLDSLTIPNTNMECPMYMEPNGEQNECICTTKTCHELTRQFVLYFPTNNDIDAVTEAQKGWYRLFDEHLLSILAFNRDIEIKPPPFVIQSGQSGYKQDQSNVFSTAQNNSPNQPDEPIQLVKYIYSRPAGYNMKGYQPGLKNPIIVTISLKLPFIFGPSASTSLSPILSEFAQIQSKLSLLFTTSSPSKFLTTFFTTRWVSPQILYPSSSLPLLTPKHLPILSISQPSLTYRCQSQYSTRISTCPPSHVYQKSNFWSKCTNGATSSTLRVVCVDQQGVRIPFGELGCKRGLTTGFPDVLSVPCLTQSNTQGMYLEQNSNQDDEFEESQPNSQAQLSFSSQNIPDDLAFVGNRIDIYTTETQHAPGSTITATWALNSQNTKDLSVAIFALNAKLDRNEVHTGRVYLTTVAANPDSGYVQFKLPYDLMLMGTVNTEAITLLFQIVQKNTVEAQIDLNLPPNQTICASGYWDYLTGYCACKSGSFLVNHVAFEEQTCSCSSTCLESARTEGCSVISSDTAVCTCLFGAYGENCQFLDTFTDPCPTALNCQNGSKPPLRPSCFPESGPSLNCDCSEPPARCQCPVGSFWAGDDCSECQLKCDPRGTQTGTDANGLNSNKCTQCQCKAGYSGPLCQFRALLGSLVYSIQEVLPIPPRPQGNIMYNGERFDNIDAEKWSLQTSDPIISDENLKNEFLQIRNQIEHFSAKYSQFNTSLSFAQFSQLQIDTLAPSSVSILINQLAASLTTSSDTISLRRVLTYEVSKVDDKKKASTNVVSRDKNVNIYFSESFLTEFFSQSAETQRTIDIDENILSNSSQQTPFHSLQTNTPTYTKTTLTAVTFTLTSATPSSTSTSSTSTTSPSALPIDDLYGAWDKMSAAYPDYPISDPKYPSTPTELSGYTFTGPIPSFDPNCVESTGGAEDDEPMTCPLGSDPDLDPIVPPFDPWGSSSNSTTLIVALVVSLVLAVLLMIGVAIWCKWWSKREKEREKEREKNMSKSTEMSVATNFSSADADGGYVGDKYPSQTGSLISKTADLEPFPLEDEVLPPEWGRFKHVLTGEVFYVNSTTMTSQKNAPGTVSDKRGKWF